MESVQEESLKEKDGPPLGHITKTHKPQPADSCALPCGIASSGQSRINQENDVTLVANEGEPPGGLPEIEWGRASNGATGFKV